VGPAAVPTGLFSGCAIAGDLSFAGRGDGIGASAPRVGCDVQSFIEVDASTFLRDEAREDAYRTFARQRPGRDCAAARQVSRRVTSVSSTNAPDSVSGSPPRLLDIEMVVPSLVTAGMEMVVATLARALKRRGHHVGVTCTQEIGAVGEQLRSEGFPVELVPAPGVLTNFWPGALRAWFLTRQPDVVHVHSGVWLKAARAAYLSGRIPLVHTVHGLLDVEPWHEGMIKRAAARYSSAIVTVSEALRADLCTRVGVRAPDPRVILNGIDTVRFAPGPHTGRLRAELGLAASARVVGHVGRFAPVKNHRLLINAFARIAAGGDDVHLALIGDGELRNDLERQVAERSLERRVHFVGEQRDVAPLLSDLDAFVLCSLAEGTSISLLEALAAGVPCVATAVGGNVAVLDHGGAGRLVPSGDVDALAGALQEILTSPRLRHDLSQRARQRAIDAYGEGAMTQAYEEVYYTAIAGRRAR